MNTSSDIEARKKKIETLVKILALCVAGFFFAPIAIMTIKGLVSLIVVAVIGLAAVNIGIPWLAVSLANWRLKALKAAAAANPIEMLENQYKDKMDALAKSRENIKKTICVLENLHSLIVQHDEKFPGKPSQYTEKYTKLKQLIENQNDKYQIAKKNLAKFSDMIEEKRSDWEIAKTMAEVSKLANVGEDFQTKLLQDTAVSTIQDGLNMAFSELEVSLLDAPTSTSNMSTTTVEVIPASKTTKQLSSKSDLPVLDLDFQSSEPEQVKVNRRNN